MSSPLMTYAAVDAYRRERMAEAAKARLVAAANCCRPSTISTAARAIGTQLRAITARRDRPAACCA